MATVQKKEKGLQKYSFRGYTPEQIDTLTTEQIVELFRARQRRRFARSNLSWYMRNQAQIQQTLQQMQKVKEKLSAWWKTCYSQDSP